MKRSGVSRTSRLDTSSAVAVLFWAWLWGAVWADIISCKTSAVGRSEPHRGDGCRVSASRVTRLRRPLTAVVASVVIIPLGAIATSAADLRSPASRLAPSTSYTRVVTGVHESVSDVKLEHRINTYPLAPSVYDFVPQPARSSSASVPRRGPRAPAELAAVEARASFSRVGMAANTARAAAEAEAAALRQAGGRLPTATSAAVDMTTGRVFTGTSGESVTVPEALRSRLPDPSIEPWSAANCAEVAASATMGNSASIESAGVAAKTVRPGATFERVYEGGGGVLAQVDEAGILNLAIERGPASPAGGAMFNEALSSVGR